MQKLKAKDNPKTTENYIKLFRNYVTPGASTAYIFVEK